MPPCGRPQRRLRRSTTSTMGEHGTWFDYLNRFSWWQDFNHWAEGVLGRKWQWMMFGESGWTLTHVLVALTVCVFTAWGCFAFFRGLKGKDQGLVPPRKMNLRNFFEYTDVSVYGMVGGDNCVQHDEKFIRHN